MIQGSRCISAIRTFIIFGLASVVILGCHASSRPPLPGGAQSIASEEQAVVFRRPFGAEQEGILGVLRDELILQQSRATDARPSYQCPENLRLLVGVDFGLVRAHLGSVHPIEAQGSYLEYVYFFSPPLALSIRGGGHVAIAFWVSAPLMVVQLVGCEISI